VGGQAPVRIEETGTAPSGAVFLSGNPRAEGECAMARSGPAKPKVPNVGLHFSDLFSDLAEAFYV
jgi:hypothetical protein